MTIPDDHDYIDPVISANRHVVAYTRQGLGVGQDEDRYSQVYAYQRSLTGAGDIIEVTHDPAPGDGSSNHPAVNEDGKQIAFESVAANLVDYCDDCPFVCSPAQSVCHELSKIYVRDRDAETTILISRNTDGELANADSFRPAISASGRFISFESEAGNLAPGNTLGTRNIFIRDRDDSNDGVFDEPDDVLTIRVSQANTGEPSSTPDADSFAPSVIELPEITLVAYHSYASNLVPGSWAPPSTDHAHVYLAEYDPGTAAVTTTLVSRHYDGLGAANGDSINPRLSSDGKWLVFASNSSELHDAYTTQEWRIYIYNIEEEEIDRVLTIDDVNGQSGDELQTPVISRDGRFVAFGFEPDGSDPAQIYLHDRGPMLLGDLNGDGVVDEADLDILCFNWGPCECCAADLTGDGNVGYDDLQIILEQMEDPPPGCI